MWEGEGVQAVPSVGSWGVLVNRTQGLESGDPENSREPSRIQDSDPQRKPVSKIQDRRV